jgi:hypothetical protein
MSEQTDIEKQLEEAQQTIATYQLQQILSNQIKFNEWMMGQVLALKEGINQIGLILSEATEQEEEVKPVEQTKPVVKPVAKKPSFMSKLGMAAKGVTTSLDEGIKNSID